MDILEFFDITNTEHINAFALFDTTGRWPEKFIPEGTTFQSGWHYSILSKMGAAYMIMKLANES